MGRTCQSYIQSPSFRWSVLRTRLRIWKTNNQSNTILNLKNKFRIKTEWSKSTAGLLTPIFSSELRVYRRLWYLDRFKMQDQSWNLMKYKWLPFSLDWWFYFMNFASSLTSLSWQLISHVHWGHWYGYSILLEIRNPISLQDISQDAPKSHLRERWLSFKTLSKDKRQNL